MKECIVAEIGAFTLLKPDIKLHYLSISTKEPFKSLLRLRS